MKLRRQLLILSLLVLALPLAAWQFVGELEELLRQALSQAQQQALQAVAGNLQQRQARMQDLYDKRQALYLQPLPAGMQLDGYGEDWPREAPQFHARNLQGWLGRTADALWLRLEVADDHFRYSSPGRQQGDGFYLWLQQPQDLIRLPLFWEGLGSGELPLPGARRLEYAVTDLGGRYGVELRLPVLPLKGVALEWWNDGQPLLRLPESGLWPLTGYDRSLEFLLAGHAAADARYWLLHPDGWVLARSEPPQDAPADERPWWQNWLYRLLSGPLDLDTSQPEQRWRLQSAAIEQARKGQPAVEWLLEPDSGRLATLAALPLKHDGTVVAILASRQDNNRLLTLAANALRQLLLVSGAVFLLAVLILLIYASLLTRRVRRLKQAVDTAWHEQHGLNADFEPSRAKDELGELSRAYAEMLGSLGQHTRYLRSLADKLSHELKTPLAVVRSSLENLEMEQDLSQSAYLQRAQSGLARLQRILQAMTEANRLEQSIQQEQQSDVALSDLLAEYVAMARSTCAHCRIEADIAPGLHIRGAAELLIQLLDKLLDNACSHCPQGGWIRFSLEKDDQHIVLRVANQGPPLPQDTPAERLFDSMVSIRGHSHEREAPHLGLGLYIVQLIARFHEAGVSARNLPEGDGVCFSVYFPAKASVA